MPESFDFMSDALGFAEGADAGKRLRFYRAAEFFFDGIRLNPGTYELRKAPDDARHKIEIAALAALTHHKPDYRSPRKLDEAAKVIADFVEAELNK